MSADKAGAVASASVPPPAAREVPRPPASTPHTKVAPAAAQNPAALTLPKAELKAPEKPALSIDLAEQKRNLEEAIQRLNDQMRRNGRDLAFAVDQEVDRTVITVRHAQTGAVVRQIPDDAVLRVAHSIEDIKGLLLNASA